jgi:hypothetical protein
MYIPTVFVGMRVKCFSQEWSSSERCDIIRYKFTGTVIKTKNVLDVPVWEHWYRVLVRRDSDGAELVWDVAYLAPETEEGLGFGCNGVRK